MLALGASEGQIHRLAEQGILRRRTRGVFVVAGARVTWEQGAHVAGAAHPSGASSHRTAGGFHEVVKRPPVRPKVTIEPGSTHRSKVADIFVSPLEREDVTNRFGLRVTSLERTVVDLCGELAEAEAINVIDSVLTGRRTTPGRLLDVLERLEGEPGRRGSGVLRAATAIWIEAITPGSESEARLVRQLLGWGFPEPQLQVRFEEADGTLAGIADVVVDRAVLEYDSARHHGPRRWPRDSRLAARVRELGLDIRSVDKLDILPGESNLLFWLARRVVRVA